MTTGTDQDTAQVATECSQAEYPQEEASPQQAGQEGLPPYRQHPEHSRAAMRQ